MKLITTIAAAIAALAIAAVASAAPPQTAPGKNPLTCFGDPASCTSNGKTATIDTTGTNGGAGVYLAGYNSSFYGVRTNLVTKLSNTVTGSPLGIDPRWSIPIDDRNDPTAPAGYTDYFVFVTFADCNNGAGLVDVINDATCTIYAPNNVTYPNWSAFVTANPNTYIALNDNYAFIIADESGAEGVWTISNVQVGKPGK